MNALNPKPIVDIIGFPMDLGANRRGVDLGPAALRIAGIETRLQGLGYQVDDQGDIPIRIQHRNRMHHPGLKHRDEIHQTSEMLAKIVATSLSQSHFPLCIGGDHSMAIGTIAGIAAHCRKTNKTPGVIWIDAHADMNMENTTPSGNIHGMPMAISLGLGDKKLTQVAGFSPKLVAENCALIGIRRIDRLEKRVIQKMHLPVYTMTDIDRKGAHTVISEILTGFSNQVDHIHVSFDLDSVDPTVATGVGTPVRGGLSYREAHLIMETIAETGRLASFEVAEVNPILDHKNQSAEFAAEIVASSLGLTIMKRLEAVSKTQLTAK